MASSSQEKKNVSDSSQEDMTEKIPICHFVTSQLYKSTAALLSNIRNWFNSEQKKKVIAIQENKAIVVENIPLEAMVMIYELEEIDIKSDKLQQGREYLVKIEQKNKKRVKRYFHFDKFQHYTIIMDEYQTNCRVFFSLQDCIVNIVLVSTQVIPKGNPIVIFGSKEEAK